MIISDEQVKQIANNIAFDVRQYIQEHQKQYEDFLKKETKNSQYSDESSMQKGDYLDENESKKDSRSSKP